MMDEGKPESPFGEFEEHLYDHVRVAVRRAHDRLGGPLNSSNLAQFLTDSECVRYPVEIVFDAEPLESHQFAEPVVIKEEGETRCRLYVHPRFAARDDVLPYFVAYMAAPINYGAVATPELCETYGAALVGEEPEAFYQKLCALMDEAPGES